MAIPPGRYTRQQIRDRALNAAGNRGLNIEAVTWLSQRLFDLATLYSWPFLARRADLVLGLTFALPEKFQQSVDDTAMQILSVDGQRHVAVLRETTRDEVESAVNLGAGAGQIPLVWTANLTSGFGHCGPDPTGRTIAAQLRYQELPTEPDEADEPADIPWFPWHSYLVQAVFVDALRHENDARLPTEQMRLDQLFMAIRRASVPLRSQLLVIPHEPSVFRTPFRGD